MRITQVGTYTLPLWNKRDVVSMGSHGGAISALIGGGAYDSYGYEDAPEDALTVSTSFEIVATMATDVQKYRDEIRALAGKKDRLYATFPDATTRFAWARLARVRMERRMEYIYYQPVELDFEITTPGWRGGFAWTLDSDESLDTGLYLDYRGGTWIPDASDDSTTVTTDGNRMVPDALFVVMAGSDDISQVRVRVGACDWTWKSTIPAGDVLIVNSGTKTITLEGADAYSVFTLNAGHTVGDWLQLQPGSNTVTVSYVGNASGTALIAFSYLDMWA